MPTWGSLPRGLPTNKTKCRKNGDSNYYSANKYAAKDTITFYYRTKGYGPSRRADPAKDVDGTPIERHGSEYAGYGICNKDTYNGHKIGEPRDLICEFESSQFLRKTVPCKRPFCSTNTNLAANNAFPTRNPKINTAPENNYCHGQFRMPYYPCCPPKTPYYLKDYPSSQNN